MPSRYDYTLAAHPVDYGVLVDVNDLDVDPLAQRSLNEQRAKDIADHMVPEALGSIIVSQRADTTKWIVDGRHRWYACRLNGMAKMTAEIHHGLSQQEEAILFLIKNRESSKPNAFDEYKVGLTAKLPLFVDTDAVMVHHGLMMGNSSANQVGAVAGVLRITERYGPDVLDRTLVVAEEAWGRTTETWDGMLLGGIGMFLGKHGAAITNNTDLAKKIATGGPAYRWRSAVSAASSSGGLGQSGTGGRITACYKLILDHWNKGRRPANKITAI